MMTVFINAILKPVAYVRAFGSVHANLFDVSNAGSLFITPLPVPGGDAQACAGFQYLQIRLFRDINPYKC